MLLEYGHANQPHLVRDIQQKKKILDVLESATRGLRRMDWKAPSTVPTPAQPDYGCPFIHTGDARAFVYLPRKFLKLPEGTAGNEAEQVPRIQLWDHVKGRTCFTLDASQHPV